MFRSDRPCQVPIDSVTLLLLALAAMALLVGCDTIQKWEDMSPKAKALWLMSTYNHEFQDYAARAAQGEKLTETQREVLRAKKIALRKAWPLVKFYAAMVRGGTASAAAELAALDAIRELIVTVEEALNE